MKSITLQKRIEKKLFTANGTLACRYSFLDDFLIRGIWHGKSWNYSGRYCSLSDTQYRAAIEICEALKIDFVLGNDAPRGGKAGDFVEITKKGKRQIAEWVKEKVAERKENERIKAEKKAQRITEGEKKVADAMEILNENADFVKNWAKSGTMNGKAFHELAGALKVQNTNAFRVAVNKFFNPNHYYNPEYI
jgi:hypothetical protein